MHRTLKRQQQNKNQIWFHKRYPIPYAHRQAMSYVLWFFLKENWPRYDTLRPRQMDNIPALVQIMAWRRLGDKPLSEPMMVSLPTHICVTRPQCDNGTALQLTWKEEIGYCNLWTHAKIKYMSTSWEIALRWISQNTLENNSPLVQAMAWCPREYWFSYPSRLQYPECETFNW